MATFLGLHFFFGVKPHIWLDAGLLLMFYALYYGVMARDIAEICTEKMVSQIGVSLLAKISTYLVKIPVGNITIFSLLFFFQYYKPSGIPVRQLDSNMCALCGNQFLVQVGQEGVVENTYRLSCSHE